MTISKDRMTGLLKNDSYPRSAKYDPEWVLKGWMGPNVLWLTEWLCEKMDLKPGMRVLDMGCGKARSSIFLAREYGVQVWANDLWITATENLGYIREMGLEDSVFPIHAEAHDLPYAGEFFDAIVSLDSYQYYGTDDIYLTYFHKFVKPGGQISIVVPGLARDFPGGNVPEHLARPQANGRVFWQPECWCFHTADWWQRHWAQTGLVDMEVSDLLPDGWKDWAQFEKAAEETGLSLFPSDEETLKADAGEYIGLVRVVGRRKDEPGL
ncbi:MAG: methyltransferase domain-containing protein [Dehalococcoidales bacterium]|nr:methyltransferase domain-containing protein [Dehalococcoidales bacterium]